MTGEDDGLKRHTHSHLAWILGVGAVIIAVALLAAFSLVSVTGTKKTTASEAGMLGRLREIRAACESVDPHSEAYNRLYTEDEKLSTALIQMIRSKPDSEKKLRSLIMESSILRFTTGRKLPILTDEVAGINAELLMKPPLPRFMGIEHAIPVFKYSASVNGEPAEVVDGPNSLLSLFYWKELIQIRSDRFRPGENKVSVQAHIELFAQEKGETKQRSTSIMKWSTPLVTETVTAQRGDSQNLVRLVSPSGDISALKRGARAAIWGSDREFRSVDVAIKFPALSVPICAAVSARAADGKWVDDQEKWINVPAGSEDIEFVSVFYGEEVRPPLKDNLKIVITLRPDREQAYLKDLPKIAGYEIVWEIPAGQMDGDSKMVVPIRVGHAPSG